MIQHIVLFKLKAGIDEETIARHIDDFAALGATIPAIEQIEVRRDIVGREVSAEFGIASSFRDMDALQAYRTHPEHVAAFARLQTNLDHMLVWDYEAG